MKRHDEDFAKEAWTRHLSRRKVQGVSWADGPEPPDYLLRVGTRAFAVEVTFINEQITVGTEVLPEFSVSAIQSHFIDQLRKESADRGMVSGAYVLYQGGLPEKSSSKKAAMESALSYVESTFAEDSAPEQVILESDGAYWTIKKHHRNLEYVEAVTSSGTDGILVDQHNEELASTVRQAVSEKESKLSDIQEDTILLLLDSFGSVDPEVWRSSLSEYSSADSFHTIARIHGDYECQILCSKGETWA